MLKIKNLHVAVEGKEILKGIELEIAAGEVHAVMGPNGSGKSTLAHVLAGREGYEITDGSIEYRGENLREMEADERARAGLFLGFQYPVEIPGVSGMTFLKTAVNTVRKHRGESELDAMDFMKLVKDKAEELDMDEEMLKRPLNVGFSGGEKKRNEIMQMALLDPYLAVLDETDSGLDIDALKIVADGINRLRGPEKGILLITHYQRLLNYVEPDKVHVLARGRIRKSGGKELAEQLEQEGYAAFGEKDAA